MATLAHVHRALAAPPHDRGPLPLAVSVRGPPPATLAVVCHTRHMRTNRIGQHPGCRRNSEHTLRRDIAQPCLHARAPLLDARTYQLVLHIQASPNARGVTLTHAAGEMPKNDDTTTHTAVRSRTKEFALQYV